MPESVKTTTAQLSQELIAMIGRENVAANEVEGERQYRLLRPIVAYPREEKDVQQILAWASANQVRIAPQGGGTKDAYGLTCDGADVILSLKNMTGILHHSIGDLTVTVLPGTTMRELQQSLNQAGQFLPLDPAWVDQSTVGGVIASNASGPRRALYGSARDYLIATRVCYPDGTVIRTGAKVVKNVAGYDMNKLFIGSMGTLGVFTELTFKIRPIPASAGAMVIRNAGPQKLCELQEMLLDSHLEPSSAEWINERLAKQIWGSAIEGPVLLVTFEDVKRSVQFQLNWLKQKCGHLGITDLEEFTEVDGIFAGLRDYLPNANDLQDECLAVSVKLLSMMSDVPAIYEAAQKVADEKGLPLDFHGGLYTGISRATVRTEWRQQQALCEWLHAVESFIGRLNGRSVIEVAPRSLKMNLNIWGAEAADWGLMKGIKQRIDPKRILNPGRFIGGI